MKASDESFTNPISVVIADYHPVVRECLLEVLKAQAEIKVVAEAANVKRPWRCVSNIFQMCSYSIFGCRRRGLQVLAKLAARGISRPRVIVMTTCESEDDIHRAAKTGAKGYLLKGTAP
jgi:DNA-binding NarL/FixJ family response regulator